MDQPHIAQLDTSPDADPDRPVCRICGRPVIGPATDLLHQGEARRPQIVPARADLPAVRRAELLAERALQGIAWAPHVTDADRAAAVVQELYAAGLIAQRPRTVRARPVRPGPLAPAALAV